MPAGSGSVTVTFTADEGPSFVTVIEYVTVLPATTGSTESVLEMRTSALGWTVVPCVAELLAFDDLAKRRKAA